MIEIASIFIIPHAQLYKQNSDGFQNHRYLILYNNCVFYCFKSAAAAVSKNHCTSPLTGAIN